MKSSFLFVLLLFSSMLFSQKTAIKKFQTISTEVTISTNGLDSFELENSDSQFIEISLYAENPNKQHIVVEDKNGETVIQFNIPTFKNEEAIFRKYITKRLKRATATIKLPKNIKVSIFGDEINVTSKSYNGNLRIFIEKGIVKLDTIQQDLALKLYGGNVFANIKKTNLNVVSKFGNIKIDNEFHQKKYQVNVVSSSKEIAITTLKANIFLTTQ